VIPEEQIIRVCEIIDEITIPVMMEPGDLVMVDNYQVQHGRYPWFDGERKIVVAMWDTENPTERIRAY
jgi:alpha-ketoglutarate-dependent taurine dioxygenase